MVDQELLKLLVCPEDKTPVSEASADVVAKVNSAVKAGTLTNRGGEPVAEAIDGGLIRQDGKYLYPVREDIPIMLIDEAIPLDQVN